MVTFDREILAVSFEEGFVGVFFNGEWTRIAENSKFSFLQRLSPFFKKSIASTESNECVIQTVS